MKYRIYEHRHGAKEIPAHLRDEIAQALNTCAVRIGRGKATALRDGVLAGLQQKGWPPEVVIDPASKISLTSIREHIGLCLQTGNMGRMYADLLKLQTVYLRETIRAGVFIVAVRSVATKLGDNLANFERLVRELQIFERAITIPLMVVGIEE